MIAMQVLMNTSENAVAENSVMRNDRKLVKKLSSIVLSDEILKRELFEF